MVYRTVSCRKNTCLALFDDAEACVFEPGDGSIIRQCFFII